MRVSCLGAAIVSVVLSFLTSGRCGLSAQEKKPSDPPAAEAPAQPAAGPGERGAAGAAAAEKGAASKEGTVKAAEGQGAPGQLPPGIVARLNGREVTIEQYTAYLFATLGKSKVREFIDRLLLEEEGKRLEVNITPEEVEDRVNAEVENMVRALHGNSLDRFREELSRRSNLSFEEYKQKRRQETAYQLLEEKSILQTRKVTDEDVRARFEQTYGPGGVQYELRHILVSTRPRAAAPGEQRVALNDQEARAKAEKIHKELLAGGDFGELVKAYSDDELTKRNEGRIPHYRKDYKGQEFHEAVLRLTEENRLSPVVRSPQGYHIIQLIDRKTTRFEDKREEIRAVLEKQPPTLQERNAFIKGLREKAKIEM